jgi:hypothetical protein
MQTMVLVRDEAFGYYTEQKGISLDKLVEQMGKALPSENAAKPRSFEVIEVQVARRFEVTREVKIQAVVTVVEDEIEEDAA